MRCGLRGLTFVGLACLAGLAVAQAPDGGGFLQPGYLNLVDVILPAPIAQEPRGVADREIFKSTRAMKGSERWTMAIGDMPSDPASMMRGLSLIHI